MNKKSKTQLRAVIGIGNYKGGVGKTTTTLNLAMALHLQGYRVMVIDMDRQCNLSSCLGWDLNLEDEDHPTIFHVLCKDASIPVYRSESGLYYCPSTSVMKLVDQNLPTLRNPAMKLTRALQKVPDDRTGEGLADWETCFDFILIDSPVGPEVLTDNILIAANAVLIPINLEGFALRGLKDYLAYVQDIRETENDELQNLGFLITRRGPKSKDKDKPTNQDVAESDLRAQYNKDVLPIIVGESEAVKNSQRDLKSVYQYPPAVAVRKTYTALAFEIVKRTKGLI